MWRRRNWLYFGMAVLTILSVLGYDLVNETPQVDASVSSPGMAGSPGYIDATTLGISGSDTIYFLSSDGIASTGRYFFDKEPLYINQDGGGQVAGYITGYDLTSRSYKNGYNMISTSDLADYVSALGGNKAYVESQIKSLSAQNQQASVSINLFNFANVVDNSGAIFEPVQTSTSGNVITTSYFIQTSLPPRASVKASSVIAGQPVTITTTSQIDTYHTGYHFVGVKMTGPSGTKWLAGSGHNPATNMAKESGGDTDNYDGKPPTWHTYTHQYTVQTSSLASGTYTVSFYLRDSLWRAASAATVTFTVPSSGGSGGGGTGNGTGNGTGTSCPAPTVPPEPQDKVLNYNWSTPNANGDQTLTWKDTNWQLETVPDAQGCPSYQWVDQPKTYSHTYNASVGGMQIAGLFYDPGTPQNLWTPHNKTASQKNHDAYTDGSTVGGSPAQPTFGNPSQHPAIYVTINGGVEFRMKWTGSPDNVPASASVNYTWQNPGVTYAPRQWTARYNLLPATEVNDGTVPQWDANGYGYPPPASEYGAAWTRPPKYAVQGTPTSFDQLAEYNMDGDPNTAAFMNVQVHFHLETGTTSWSDNHFAQALSYPTWFYIHEVPTKGAKYEQPQSPYNNGVTWKPFPKIASNGQLIPQE